LGGRPIRRAERNLLLGELSLKRDDALLLGHLLHIAVVDVDLRGEADVALLLRLVEQRGCGVQLRVGGSDALTSGDDLEISSADGEHDGVAGIARGELRGVGGFARRAGSCSTRWDRRWTARRCRGGRCC